MNEIRQEYIDEINRHYGAHQSSGWFRMRCPFHNGKKKTSFALKVENGFGFCHSQCKKTYYLDDFIEHLGLEKKHGNAPIGTLPYHLYKTKKNETIRQRKIVSDDGVKRFETDHLNKKKQWVSGKGTKSETLPYQHEAIPDHDTVYIVEGEACVDRSQHHTKHLVTTSIGGSGAAHKTDWSALEGKNIIFVPDLDDSGFEYISAVAGLIKKPKSMKVILLESTEKGFDIKDYLENVLTDEKRLEDLPTVDFDEWLNSTDNTFGKFITKDRRGIEIAMSYLNYEMRHCVLKQKNQLKLPDGNWYSFNDILIDCLRTEIEEQCQVQKGTSKKPLKAEWPDTKWTQYTNKIVSKNIVNSFKSDYLDNLPKWEKWMTKSDYLFTLALGAEDTPLNRAIGRMMIQAIVERAFLPTVIHDEEEGIKFDYLPILIGTEEGEGKSSFCERLVPFPSMYGNRFNFADNVQKQQESIRGKVVIEVNELIGIDRAQIETLKVLLSISKEPQVRKAYAKHEKENPRRCVFIGTTNDEKPIPMTGTRNRRFIPIRVSNKGRKHVVDWLEENRDQIFAHGIHCMNEKMPLFLSKSLETDQESMVILHTNKDDDEESEIILYYNIQCGLNRPYFKLIDLVTHLYSCEADISKAVTLMKRYKWQLAKTLRINGFESKKMNPENTGRANYWYHPKKYTP